jgi:alcohol dehydrogenase
MKRLEICSYGPLPQCVRFAESDLPAVGDHDILVKVIAASVNPIDYKMVHGDLRRVHRLNFPAPFGFDCCGRIETLGSKVIGHEAGDIVYARAPRDRMGTFAEFVAIESRYVAKAPTSLSAQAAASLPLVALTTVQALVDRAKAQKGQSILIHAGSGGLGSFAIQYAKQELGLHVTTTTSSKNADWVSELGADVVVAYDQEDYASLPARYDIVFDTLGGSTTAASFSVLKSGGTVVSVAGPPDRAFARQIGANPALSFVMWCVGLPMELRTRRVGGHYFRFLTESSGAQLEHVGHVVDAGKIRTVIEKIYPFDQAIEALQYAATGRAKGKLVIQISSG